MNETPDESIDATILDHVIPEIKSIARHPSGAVGADFELQIIRESAGGRSGNQAPISGEVWFLTFEAGPAPLPSWSSQNAILLMSMPTSGSCIAVVGRITTGEMWRVAKSGQE